MKMSDRYLTGLVLGGVAALACGGLAYVLMVAVFGWPR